MCYSAGELRTQGLEPDCLGSNPDSTAPLVLGELTSVCLRIHIYTPTSTAALLTTVICKQTKCPLTDEQSVVSPYNGILFSLENERNSDTCCNICEPGGRYAE